MHDPGLGYTPATLRRRSRSRPAASVGNSVSPPDDPLRDQDGYLSVTIASSVSSQLTQPDTLNLTTSQAADIGTAYLIGEVIGALVFGKF